MNPTSLQLDSVIEDLPRGRDPDDIGTAPNACFESPHNVIATKSLRFDAELNRESKLFLGVLGAQVRTGERLRDGRLTRYAIGGWPVGVGDDRHVVTVAGSRSGKGRSALVANALSLPAETSLLCVDPKGDIARLTATWRARRQPVAVLDPFGISGDHTQPFHVAYNALEMLLRSNRRTFIPNAKLIADSLIVSGDFKDKHWDECSRAMLAGICAHVATHTNYEGRRDLITVWRIAGELSRPDPEDPNRYILEKEMAGNDAAGGAIRAAARAFYDRTGGEFSSVLSNLCKHLDWISIECMHDVLRGRSINLAELKRSAMSLYVTLPALRMTDLSGWLRLIAQMSFAAFEEETRSSGHQAVFMLDEFSVLGRLKCAETAIAQLAGLGVKCWIVIQDLSQLKNNYKDNWETFIANSGLLQFFGGADETTLSYVSKLLGQAMTISRSVSSPSFDQAVKEAATGASWSLADQPLMTGAELGRFFGRDDKLLRQLIIRPSYRPMILQRAFYDKHELFREKYWRPSQ